MSILSYILPKNEEFFGFFDQHIYWSPIAALKLIDIFNSTVSVLEGAEFIKSTEHQGDEVTKKTLERLHTVFITPFDRENIHSLISALDDFLDGIDEVSQALVMYGITSFPLSGTGDMASYISQSAHYMKSAVKGLRDIKENHIEIRQACAGIKRSETDGDTLYRQLMTAIFQRTTSIKDPLDILRWKAVLDALENTLDCGERVANIIETLILEHT
jgi:hypothetical protein